MTTPPPERPVANAPVRPYETVVCSYTVTHGMACCWHMDGRPSTRVVTLGDDRGACDHYVCTECGDKASQGDLPEQHSDQSFIDLRGRFRADAPSRSVARRLDRSAQTEAPDA